MLYNESYLQEQTVIITKLKQNPYGVRYYNHISRTGSA